MEDYSTPFICLMNKISKFSHPKNKQLFAFIDNRDQVSLDIIKTSSMLFFEQFLDGRLLVSKMRVYVSMNELKEQIDEFYKGDQNEIILYIHDSLRKPLRELHILYPTLVYFAFNIIPVYRLVLSKSAFTINISDLSDKARRLAMSNLNLRHDLDVNTTSGDPSNLLEFRFDIKSKLQSLNDLLLAIGTEKDFMNKHYEIRSLIEKNILASAGYESWKDLQVVPPVSMINRPEHIYEPINHERSYISIDLKCANFQVLKLHGLIDPKHTWSSYMEQFADHSNHSFFDHDYYKNSKKIRLIALSTEILFVKKQQAVWTAITLEIMHAMLKDGIILPEDVAAYNSDEIIVSCSSKYEIIQGYLAERFVKYELSTKQFQLLNFDKHYVLLGNNGVPSFKCVTGKQLPKLVEQYLTTVG